MGHGAVDLDPLVGMDDPGKPLRSKILQVPAWRKQYLQNLKVLAEIEMAPEKINPFLDQYRQLLANDVRLETRRTSSEEAFFQATETDHPAEGSLSHFFSERRQFLLSHPEIQKVTLPTAPGRPTTATEILPRSGTVGIVINELLAKSKEGSDWIELYNPTEATVSLDGYGLSDSTAQPGKWMFPAGTELGAGDYLLIWADEEAEPGLHANFKLSAKGEVLTLVRKRNDDWESVDRVRFPKLGDGIAYARLPDGQGRWQPAAPTPGAANREP